MALHVARRAWGLMALAFVLALAGTVVRAIHGGLVGAEFPLPSPADLFVFASYASFVASLTIFVRGRNAGADLAGQLAAVLISVSVGYVTWVFTVGDYLVDPTQPIGERVMNGGYFAVQLVVMTATVRLLLARGVRSTPYYLLTASSVTLVAADLGGTILVSAAIDPLPVIIINVIAGGFAVAAIRHPEAHKLVALPQDIEPSEEGRWSWLASSTLVLPVLARVLLGSFGTIQLWGTGVFIVTVAAVLMIRGRDLTHHREELLDLASRLALASDKMSGRSGRRLDRVLINELRTVLGGDAYVEISDHRPDVSQTTTASHDDNGHCGQQPEDGDLAVEIREKTDQGWLFAVPALDATDRWVQVITPKVLGARQRNSVRSLVRSWAGAEVAASNLAEKEWSKALVESEKRQRALIDNSADITAVLDDAGDISYINRAISAVLGRTAEQVTNRPIIELLADPGDISRWRQMLRRCTPGHPAHEEFSFRHADGTHRAMAIVVNDHRQTGLINGLVVNARDVSVTRKLEHQIERDPSSGTLNRGAFLQRISTGTWDVLAVSINKWDLVSRGASFAGADEALRLMANRIGRQLRQGDYLSRVEGSTFAVAAQLDDDGSFPADEFAARIRGEIEAPVVIDQRTLRLSASVGYAPASSDPVETFQRALDALGASTEDPNGQLVVRTHGASAQITDLDLWSQMDLAIDNHEFALYYQPIVDLKTMKIASAEALIRWFHRERGFVSPAEFIPVAEQHPPLIKRIGEWVIETAARQSRLWLADGTMTPGMSLSVNVSAAQVEPELIDRFAAVMTRNHLAPSTLTVEITETLLSDNDDEATIFEALRARGHKLAIDDFGTGTSNLAKTARLQPDIIKVDRSLIIDVENSPAVRSFLAKTVDMLHSSGALVTVEGVETAEQADIVRSLGCDYAQGYFFARPAPELPTTLASTLSQTNTARG